MLGQGGMKTLRSAFGTLLVGSSSFQPRTCVTSCPGHWHRFISAAFCVQSDPLLIALPPSSSALPLNILKADFSKLTHYVTSPKRLPDMPQLHRELADTISRALARAGPDGWLEWVSGYRNMLVHRGRQMNLTKIVPERSPIVTP